MDLPNTHTHAMKAMHLRDYLLTKLSERQARCLQAAQVDLQQRVEAHGPYGALAAVFISSEAISGLDFNQLPSATPQGTLEHIARIAHEVNRGYCQSLGAIDVPHWEECTPEHRRSMCEGVEMHLAGFRSPEAAHEAWMAKKWADGWVWGEEKSDEDKTHPCLVPFRQLPPTQKAKDYIFRAVVHALTT